MSDDTTSPARVAGDSEVALPQPARSILGEWRAFFGFLRSPTLPIRARGIDLPAFAATLRMFALDVAIMAGLMALAAAATAAGAELPRSALADLDFGPLIVFTIVIIAPLIEEITFRGWLSGRPGAVWSVGLILAAAGASTLIPSQEVTPAIAVAQFAIMGLAIGLAIWLWQRPPYGWFTRLFPLLFWLSTLAFALIHLTNYDETASIGLVLFTIPQFIAGSIFGYARVRYGLWSSILLHVMHNGIIMAVVLTALGAGAEIG